MQRRRPSHRKSRPARERWRSRVAQDDDRDDEIIALCGADADNQETPAK